MACGAAGGGASYRNTRLPPLTLSIILLTKSSLQSSMIPIGQSRRKETNIFCVDLGKKLQNMQVKQFGNKGFLYSLSGLGKKVRGRLPDVGSC